MVIAVEHRSIEDYKKLYFYQFLGQAMLTLENDIS
jgi:hypothetical protein